MEEIGVGEMAVVVGRQYLYTSFGKIGRIKELDNNVQSGERFAVMDIEGVEYCFNVKELRVADKK